MEGPTQIKVFVKFSKSFKVMDYTGKFVKSLLISGCPHIEEVFAKASSFPPKPIHISPLYIHTEKGIRAVYPRWVPKGYIVKEVVSTAQVKPILIESGRTYFFYVGTSAGLLEKVLQALAGVDRFTFGHFKIAIDDLRYEVDYLDVNKEADKVRKALEDSNYLKVVFSSPTLLRDPLALYKSKFRVLIPLPEAVLATPLLMYLLDLGRYRRTLLLKLALFIRSALNLPYSTMETARTVWYVYDNKLLPAMIGYAKYYPNADVIARISTKVQSRYNLDFLDAISKAIALSKVYGLGSGRAAGFGHVSWEVSGRTDSPTDAGLKAGNPGS
jgi:hypothetical protein